MKSLNAYYAASEADPLHFHYWCNCLGEINPLDDPQRCGTPDDLPDDPRFLYLNLYRPDFCGVCNYVVSIEHVTGLAVVWLCNFDFASFEAVKLTARQMEKDFPFASVFVGENTDPDGNEILLFIPQDKLLEFYCAVPANDASVGERYYRLAEEMNRRAGGPEVTETYAQTCWSVPDVLAAAAEDGVVLTAAQAAAWWKKNERSFREALTQYGNEMLSCVDWGEVQRTPV